MFEQLYRAHYHKVAVYVARRTRSPEDADDVVASTFLVAWNRIDRLASVDEPLAWLYAVAYRTLLSHWRAVSKTANLADRVAADIADPIDTVGATIEERDELSEVMAAIDSLAEEDQELLRLIGWEQLSHGEVATILGISRVLVRTRLHRARRRLQAAYELGARRSTTGGR